MTFEHWFSYVLFAHVYEKMTSVKFVAQLVPGFSKRGKVILTALQKPPLACPFFFQKLEHSLCAFGFNRAFPKAKSSFGLSSRVKPQIPATKYMYM